MSKKKVKFKQEYLVKASANLLFNFLSTPSGLSKWFADDVVVNKNIFTFIWNDGGEEKAVIVDKKVNKFIRFKWLNDENEDNFFEFHIVIDELTNDTLLEIIDFADENELEEAKQLWDSQVNVLLHKIGA